VQKILTKADYLRETRKNNTNVQSASSSSKMNYAESELDRALKREIASTWQTDEVTREKPTPQNVSSSIYYVGDIDCRDRRSFNRVLLSVG